MRIRTVKPEFFLHEGLFDLEKACHLPVRLSFIGLWCAADREGRFKWEPRKLRAQILPYDDNVDFEAVLQALTSREFVIQYGEGGDYGWIPSFLSHQCINIREAQSKLPACPPDAHACTCKKVTGGNPDFHPPNGVNIPGPVAETVMVRDGRKCCRCDAVEDLTIDHIFPQCIGGTHALANLRTLCRVCNSKRPVQGQGLIDDLAKDGLTLDDMQRTCMHVQARVEGKGREGKGKEGNITPEWALVSKPEESPTEIQKRLFAIFNRRASTKWSDKELKALKALGEISDEDLTLVERYYKAPIPPAKDFRRRDLCTLLNNFTGEVDRARGFKGVNGHKVESNQIQELIEVKSL